VRSAAPHDHREVAPRDAVVDVEPPELARHRRVLLRDVSRPPGLDLGRMGSMSGLELDQGCVVGLHARARGLAQVAGTHLSIDPGIELRPLVEERRLARGPLRVDRCRHARPVAEQRAEDGCHAIGLRG